ncbi:hypothetical protein HanRHA438_Chr13g0609161 [Helianthus annuus]|nr:hypothetical protein HanRHA438_Chr13g0609161 [Helianthus annuus]
MLVRFLFVDPIIRDIPNVHEKSYILIELKFHNNKKKKKKRLIEMECLPVPTFIFALWPSDWLLVAIGRWY